MKDGDGELFVDYLGLVLDELDPHLVFGAHRDRIVEHLGRHRTEKRIWEKYRWVAEYHNAVLAQTPEGAFPPDVRKADLMVPGVEHTWRFEPFG